MIKFSGIIGRNIFKTDYLLASIISII